MKPTDPIKLVAELLDLPLMDSDGKYCGVVDDIEFSGSPGKPLKLKALLVGPGAYSGRMPAWLMAIVKAAAGDRMVRVPLAKVRTIGAVVQLDCRASELGLNKTERAVESWIPHKGAM